MRVFLCSSSLVIQYSDLLARRQTPAANSEQLDTFVILKSKKWSNNPPPS